MKPREPQLDLSRDIDFSKESRVPPYSLEVEQEVLACILLEEDPIEQVIQIFGDNGEAVFYEKRHQIIYKAMMQLYQKRQAIDLITVSEELSRVGELENIGGRPYLGELSGKVISSATHPAKAGWPPERMSTQPANTTASGSWRMDRCRIN